MNKARRARLIRMEAIRDDGFTTEGGRGWANVEDFHDPIVGMARNLRLDRTAGQPRRLAFWYEASGMVPQIANVAEPYDITAMSSGGFDDRQAPHCSAVALPKRHCPAHRRSRSVRVHIFANLREDIAAFASAYHADGKFVRLAVTEAQARQYNLPSAPLKATDNRRI
jgi:hypothetical protein